jgi:hypothetical protein
MVRLLRESLASEREAYLHECFVRLEKANSERDVLEGEFRKLRQSHRMRIHKITLENEDLRRQYEALESTVESSNWKNSKREHKIRESLARQEQTIAAFHTVLTSASSTHLFLKQNVSELRTAIADLKRRHLRTIQRAKKVCLNRMQTAMHSIIQELHKTHEDKIAELRSQIAAEKAEQTRLKDVCESMLEDVWSMTPKGMKHPDIGSADFPRRVGELCQFIDAIVESEHQSAELSLKSQIQAEIPDIDIADGLSSLSEAIERYINEKVTARQRECEALLQKGIEREQKLRLKLNEALKRIRELQTETHPADSTLFADVSLKQDAWLAQKRALDDTMLALARERVSSSSYLTDSNSIMKAIDPD